MQTLVGVGVVCTRNIANTSHLLLVQRARDPGKGQWAVPGGRMHAGETLKQTAERETFEETGVRVTAAPVGCFAFDIRVSNQLQYVVIDVRATLCDGQEAHLLVAGDDALAAIWADSATFQALEVHPMTRRLVDELNVYSPSGHGELTSRSHLHC